ncbi:hypothetical protein AB5J62_03665 [Amycolatopsis sp. cg5]|uniref:hypothetical protein n=1 Tax=Amycolatopsis sp. cg5 TaxID=3238802 RepID=UPI003523E694
MKKTLVGALVAGMLALTAGTGAAAEPTTDAPRPEQQVKLPKPTLKLSPGSVRPGGVTVATGYCFTDSEVKVTVANGLDKYSQHGGPGKNGFGAPGSVVEASIRVLGGTKPGNYPVTLECDGTKTTTVLKVVPKQVVTVPAGAPQTGGGGAAR